MKILYVSSVVNHHQIFFVKELEYVFQGNVWYAALETYEQRRMVMNFPDFEKKWIVNIVKNRSLFDSLFIEADVVLCHDRNFLSSDERAFVKRKINILFFGALV